MKRRIGIAVLICAALTMIGGSAFAAIPTQITYQGKLTDIVGQPVADGIYTMDFVIRRDATGPESYWFEAARQVQVTNGLFTVNLGEVTPIPASAFESIRWLDIRVNDVELSPRTKLTSSPYAFRAHTAEHVLSSAAVTSLNLLKGDVTLLAGDNISIGRDGNTLTISGESIPNPLPVSQSGAWNVGITGTPTVRIDPQQNTVRSTQYGAWNVGASQSGDWVVELTGLPTVRSSQSGTWDVGITGTPTVMLDNTKNTVQALQSGTWNVGVTGTPTVSVTNMPAVSINAAQNTVKSQQSGAWNVGITGTPTVSVTSMPAVSIDGSENTVKTPTISSKILLSSIQGVSLDAGYWVDSDIINCTGFREVRIAVEVARYGTPPENISVDVMFPTGRDAYGQPVWKRVGKADFAPPSQSIATGGNFVPEPNYYDYSWCLFTIPLLSDQVKLRVQNGPGGHTSPIAILEAWIYLVN